LIKIFSIILIIFSIFITPFIAYALSEEEIKLPLPQLEGKMSVEEALARRRSRRAFKDYSLTLEQVSQLLWSAQGITRKGGIVRTSKRTAPSAGAVYPLDIYLVVGKDKVEDLKVGVYHYNPLQHSLTIILEEDRRREISQACLDKNQIENAPVSLIITAEFSRLTDRFGEHRINFVYMEAGHVAQNIYLQVESLGLATVSMGGIREKDISQALNLPDQHIPLYVMPVGHY
jgi:SagB-type dehydrogenase family enzyme